MMANFPCDAHISYVIASRNQLSPSRRRIAVCDLGTFTGLVLLAEASESRLTPLIEERHTIDMLSGSGRKSRLGRNALRRALTVIRRFQCLADDQSVRKGAVVCTSAVREAPNGREFAELLKRETAYPVRVLSAQQEARLSALGATTGMRPSQRPTVVIDIGGGSTEVVFCGSGRTRFRLMPCGAARATAAWDRLISSSSKSRAEVYAKCSQAVFGDLPNVGATPPRVVGVGGTIVTLAAIHSRLKTFDAGLLHGAVLTRKWITTAANRLVDLDQRAIVRLIPFDPDRAHVLAAGTFLWAGVLNRMHADRVIVSVRGLRWGVAARLAHRGRI